MDMYEQLGAFRDHFVLDNTSESVLKSPQQKLRRLSTRQIIKKTLHLTRSKKKLLVDTES